jgi:26S proteasome regulatory subunit N7
MGDPQYMKFPDLRLAQSVFTLASPSAPSSAKQSSLTTLQDAIREHKMAPLYHYLAHPQTGKLNSSGESGSSQKTSSSSPVPSLRRTSSINTTSIIGVLGGFKHTKGADLPWDEKLYESMKRENDEELAAIQKEEDEAAEREGDTEVNTARGKRAELYARIGDKEKALEAFEKLMEKTGILASKIDIVLAIIRIAMFFDDKTLVKKSVERCAALVESGGDWVCRISFSFNVQDDLTRFAGPSQPPKSLPRSPSHHHPLSRCRRSSPSRLSQHLHSHRALFIQQLGCLCCSRWQRSPRTPRLQDACRRRS